MDALRGLPGLPSSLPVHERKGGNQRQADAFRRALAGGAGGDGPPDGGEAPAPEAPVRRRLQQAAGAGRKDEGLPRHVDVIA
jgi:hypothetical protein